MATALVDHSSSPGGKEGKEEAADALTRAGMTPQQARRVAWRRLLVATVIAAAIAGALFWAFWVMPFGDAEFNAFANWFYRHSVLLLAAALSPLMASLLVGYGYMGRAMRRRAAEKAAAKAKGAEAS